MFSYFLPGQSKTAVAPGDVLDRDLLATFGLAEVLADVSKVPAHASVLDVRQGPGGQAGTVIVPVSKHRGTPGVLYDPIGQHWKPRVPTNATSAWLGAVANDQPSSKDLERWNIVGGAELRDDAGNIWTLPIARAPHLNSEFGALPKSYTFDCEGQAVPHLVQRYRWLWELAGEIRDWYRSQSDPPQEATPEERAAADKTPFSTLVEYAARILAVNYRLGLPELTYLHDERGLPVLTDLTVHGICQAAYGWEVWDEAKKKCAEGAGEKSPAPS